MISEIFGILVLGILSSVLLQAAWKRNLFSFASLQDGWHFSISWHRVAIVFAIYFSCTIFGIIPLASFLRPFFANSAPIALSNWLSFSISLSIFLLILLYAATSSPSLLKKIWRKNYSDSYVQDIKQAFWIWIVSFPFVLFVNQIIDLLITSLSNTQKLPDQLAVHFLKLTFHYPLYFFLSVFTIIILAPLVEETLFRGFLQSFIRQHLGSHKAIAITALCFALFHYSPEQRLANIPIIVSLFILALFLGLLYETKKSLLAPITLHALFNAINVVNLYFFGDTGSL